MRSQVAWHASARVGLARPSGLVRFLRLALLVLVACAGTGAEVHGESGAVLALPLPGIKPKSGWSLRLDSRGSSSNGYRPIRVQANLLPPGAVAKGTRRLTLEIRVHTFWGRGFRNNIVRQTLEVAPGAAGGEITMLVPLHHEVGSINLEVSEDGRRLDDLSGNFGVGNWMGYWSEAMPGMLVIDANAPLPEDRPAFLKQLEDLRSKTGEVSTKLPDLRELSRLGGPGNSTLSVISGAHPTDQVLIDQLQHLPRINLLPPKGLPERWLELSCYDVIFIRLDDLRRLAEERPKALAALAAWTTTGRVLCVSGAGDGFERLERIERTLDVAPLDDADSKPRRGWTVPEPGAFTDDTGSLQTVVRAQANQFGFAQRATVATDAAGEATAAQAEQVVGDAQRKKLAGSLFVWRRWSSGVIVAFAADQPFGGNRWQWNGLFNSIPSTNWMWYQRNGMSLSRPNSGYWGGWIPGIGKAPVLTFLTLISVFVVVIGPVNYFWLLRRKRPVLMLVTVPAGAGAVALTLIAYALLADGLGVQFRQRTYTWIDQRTGRSTTWSRQTYYAGLPPRGGLLYPDDAAVFPLEPFPQSDGGVSELEWTDEGQRLKTGYVTSRSMNQFLVTRATTTDARLDVRPSLDEQGRRDGVNRLGAPIRAAVLRDEQGRLSWSDGAEEGRPARFEPIDMAEARRRISQLHQDARHEAPEGSESVERSWSRRNAWGPWNNVDAQLPAPNTFTSLLETHLRKTAELDELPRRSYLVFTERSPVSPLGVTKYQERGSLHVIQGQW